MIRGLYAAATSMKVQMNKMDVISNNMSNANTTGFKKDVVVQTAFGEELTKRIDELGSTRIGSMSNGVGTSNVVTNFTQGSVKTADGDFNIALEGKGFFCVETTDAEGNTGEKYTRNGNLSLNNEGYLVTSDGLYVLDSNDQRIMADGGKFVIDGTGKMFVNDEEIGSLKLVNFEDLNYVKKDGNDLYILKEGATETEFTGSVRQGFLESSNVNTVQEMINMISLSRNYEANQKVIQAHDSIMEKSSNQIGKM